MDKTKDYYRILGVPRNASTAAIRSAYRRLARRLQPAAEIQAAGATLHEVQQAYEVLSNAERRRRYDASLGEPEHDRFAALSRSFVGSPAAARLRRPASPATLSGEILLTPAEARAGGSLSLDMPVPSSCPACRRTGGYLLACSVCGGEGRIQRRQPVAVRIPAGVRAGAVFQVRLDEPDVDAILLTVHIATPL
jgi:DnaJ-class molecular chaperone